MDRIRVLITTPLDPAHVEAIAGVDPRLDVVYEDALIARPGFPSAHPLPDADDPAARAGWEELLAGAEVMLDVGPLVLADRLTALPRLRWIQATSAGVGELVRRLGIPARRDLVVTTASGVHARPLAEFVLLAVLMFTKDVWRLQDDQREHRWRRHASDEVRAKVVGIVGAGRIGREAARLLRQLDAHVIAVVRSPGGRTAADISADELLGIADLDGMLPRLDALVIVTPLTAETHRLIDARRMGLLPRRAIVVNIGRGDVVDEPALIEALAGGRLRGAALDVFQTEPLPPESPLWDMPNVLVCPHSAATVAAENDRIVELFCDNLGRYLSGRALRNVLDPDLLY